VAHHGKGSRKRNFIKRVTMDLIAEARRVLEKNNYTVARARATENIIHFEDGNLMGFVWAAPTVSKLLKEWQAHQDSFLKLNSDALARSELKAWNLYSVLLTAGEPRDDERPALVQIEEDFRASRKIARCGISTSEDVLNALLPFVPIQRIVPVQHYSEFEELRQRVKSVPTPAVEILLEPKGYSQRGTELILKAYANKRNKD
jgi:hypothetical protein